MRLTSFSDLSYRVLLYAASHPERLVTIDEMNRFYDVSRGHLMKVVNGLTRAGFLKSVRGRTGGVSLARAPKDINLAAVLRATEPDFQIVECMRPDNACAITQGCRLKMPMAEAMAAFLESIGKYTLADVQIQPSAFLR